MTVVTTLDVKGITPSEYRAILDELGVEQRPEAGIYLHMTAPRTSASGSSRSGTAKRGHGGWQAFSPSAEDRL